MIVPFLNNEREIEETKLPSNNFVGTVSKGHKYSFLAVAIIGIGMGYFLSVPVQDPFVGMIFGTLGIIALLVLPTYFTYRCYVDKSTLKVEYFVLCFKRKKEVHWRDVAYKRIKKDATGNPLSIHLYGTDKKKLISFDYSIVGFGKIVRMAKSVNLIRK